MKTVIILQARMNSSRFPSKIALNLNGLTVIEQVIKRLKSFDKADELIVATTDSCQDDITCALAEKSRVRYFRGSESNVLGRYFDCAKENDADQIIRATADDPLTSIDLLNKMYESHLDKCAEYTYSEGYPIGVQEEIVTFEALSKCYELSSKVNHFEHVLEYILENQNEFTVNLIKAKGKVNRPDVRVTLDTKNDFERIIKYYTVFENTVDLSIERIISFWDSQDAWKSVIKN